MRYYLELLIQRAEEYTADGEPLPLDLMIELADAGIDLSTFDH